MPFPAPPHGCTGSPSASTTELLVFSRILALEKSHCTLEANHVATLTIIDPHIFPAVSAPAVTKSLGNQFTNLAKAYHSTTTTFQFLKARQLVNTTNTKDQTFFLATAQSSILAQ